MSAKEPARPPVEEPLDPLAARAMRILITKLLEHQRKQREMEVTDERQP